MTAAAPLGRPARIIRARRAAPAPGAPLGAWAWTYVDASTGQRLERGADGEFRPRAPAAPAVPRTSTLPE